jgi:hypothetical protein
MNAPVFGIGEYNAPHLRLVKAIRYSQQPAAP